MENYRRNKRNKQKFRPVFNVSSPPMFAQFVKPSFEHKKTHSVQTYRKYKNDSCVHVCFSLYDKTGRYSKFIGTTMLSIFENANSSARMQTSIIIHLLHDNTLTGANRDKFIRLTQYYNQIVKFYNVEELCTERIAEIRKNFVEIDKTRFSIGMFYRFFIAHILPVEIEKVIYLDADIIVNLNINELWKIELEDKPLGGIPNLFQIKNKKASIERTIKVAPICKEGFVNPEDYFNSGVLLMNLKFIRNAEELLMNGMEFVRDNPQFQFIDQDILNYCFSTMYLKLPVKFNRYVMLARSENELIIEKNIYHYAGGKSGFGLNMNDSFNRLWMSYFIKTPWFNVDMRDNILKVIEQFNVAKEDLMLLSAVLTGKTRAFITDEEHVDQIERKFSVMDEEEVFIINPENEESLQKLIDLMNSSKDKKIFCTGSPNIDLTLKEKGFVEGQDFFNGFTFNSPKWASLTHDYTFILAI